MANHKAAKGKGSSGSPKKRTYTSDHDEDERPAGKGHNRIGGVETPKLKSYVERIESLEEDKAGISADIRDVKMEAKANGFDVKALNSIIRLRKLKANERTEQEYMLDLYKRALGMLDEVIDDLEGSLDG